MKRILITDDHPLVREAIRALLSAAFPRTELHEASSLKDTVDFASCHPDLDLVMLDLDLPDAKQLEAISVMRLRFPSLPIAIISANKDASLARAALAAGAAGFISKSQRPDTFIAAIEAIRDIGTYDNCDLPPPSQQEDSFQRRMASLTPQQRAVFKMIVDGRSNKILAYELDISLTTVKAHVSAVLSKLKVTSRTQAALLAKRFNIFP